MATAPYSKRAADDSPAPVPMTGNPVLENYIAAEIYRRFVAQQTGACQFLTLEVLGSIPPRTVDGMVCFFSEGVVNPQRGLYEYSGGTWRKL